MKIRLPVLIWVAAVWHESGEAMHRQSMSRSEMLELAESMEGAAKALRREAGGQATGQERVAAVQ
jgi:hypothetical protein